MPPLDSSEQSEDASFDEMPPLEDSSVCTEDLEERMLHGDDFSNDGGFSYIDDSAHCLLVFNFPFGTTWVSHVHVYNYNYKILIIELYIHRKKLSLNYSYLNRVGNIGMYLFIRVQFNIYMHYDA